MFRRNSMSLLQAIMDEFEEEQDRDSPLRRSLRRSIAVDDTAEIGDDEREDDDGKEEEDEERDEDPPDLPTSPRPELVQNVRALLSDDEHVEIVRQKRSFDLTSTTRKYNRMFLPSGRHSLDNRRYTASTSRSSSTVQTPFTGADYDFSFWGDSPGISLRSPTNRSSFFPSTPSSDVDQEDIPRSWSSRAVAHERSISSIDERWDTVSTRMSAVEQHHYHRSIDGSAVGDGEHITDKSSNGMISVRSSSTAQLITTSDGCSSPLTSPGGRVSSQSESALDEMDDDVLSRRNDLRQSKRGSGSGKQPMCGLPSGDAKNEIQYQSLEDIRSVISPTQQDSSMGEGKWRERRRKSEGAVVGGRTESPSHTPASDAEDDENGNEEDEEESKTRLLVAPSLQQSLEEGDGPLTSIQSYLGVEMMSEEEEYHEDADYSDEDDDEDDQIEGINRMEDVIKRNASADLHRIDEENDESRSRSVSRHADGITHDREKPHTGGEGLKAPSFDEPTDFAPCLSPVLEADANTTTTASESSEMVSSATTTRSDASRRTDGRSSHVSLSNTGRTTSNASTSPSEPEELAPGTSVDYVDSLSPTEETMPSGLALHRRAISNHETRHEEMQDIRRESEIVRARSSGGRSSMMAGRCQSQVMNPVSVPISPSSVDSTLSNGRNLSSSDPALNELEQAEIRAMQQNGGGVEELAYDGRDARQPPPVLLPRKQSNLNSWRSPFAVATARGVMNPRVQVPTGGGGAASRTATPPREQQRERHGTMPAGMMEREMEADEKRTGERSRVDKKKESGGTMRGKMIDSLSNAFFSVPKSKKSKTADRSLAGVMRQFGEKNAIHPRKTTLGGHPVDGLPDEIANMIDDGHYNGSSRSTDRSPSAIRSPSGADDYSFELRSLSLCSDLWDRFGLFDPEVHSAWHEKYSTEGMSSKQLKKQDAIFELIMQERRHCAHLAFLKKGYRQRLVEEHVLSAGDADRLIPDVLDAMLAFHLHLLDRLVERQRVASRVDTVADIIAEELGDRGRFTTIAVDAYTQFGAAKESAEAYFAQLLNKGGRFAGFYNKLQADHNYRRYAYKTLLTVIIGRPTKYLLMLDQILKNEENEQIAAQTKEAAEAARKFATRIDYGLQVCQMSKKWEEIKGQLEPGSKTMLTTSEFSVNFTMDDLRKDTFAHDSRKILCMGDVIVKDKSNPISVYLILFDDILVVLQKKGGRMAFITHEQAVLPVCSLHIRPTERQNTAFVISRCKPALLQFDFLNRNDRLKWLKVLETAIAQAPKHVRMTPRSDSKQQARERAMEEERMRRAEEEWLRKLEAIFEERKPEENALATYFDSRRRWFDELRRHVGEMPYRSKSDMPDKVRQTVRARFRELRAARVIPLAEMVERCSAAREGDLWAFFDDKHEMAAGPSEDSDSSGSGKSGKQPRRIQTFHGTTAETREKSSIRRHTTVPKMSECGSTASADGLHRRTESESEDSDHDQPESPEQREERVRMKTLYRVPLSLPLRARKASTRLVDDVVQLRLENNLLRNQSALDKTRIAFLERQRTPGYAAIVAPTETMEALRRKEQEVRDEETRVREAEEYGKARLAAAQKEVKEQKERLAAQEAELERKWLAYKEHTSTPSRSSSQKENGTEETRREKRVERTASTCSELSPALKGLSVKSETRRKK